MGRVGISSKTLITAAKVLQFGRHGRVRGPTVDFGRLEAAVEVGEAAQADSERQEEDDEGDDRCVGVSGQEEGEKEGRRTEGCESCARSGVLLS